MRHSDRPLTAWQDHTLPPGRGTLRLKSLKGQCGVSPFSVFPQNYPMFLFLRRVEPGLSALRKPLDLPHPEKGREVPGVDCSLVMVLLWCLPQITRLHRQNEMEQKGFCSMLLPQDNSVELVDKDGTFGCC